MQLFKDLFRPILSDATIMEYNEKGLLIEQPISETQLQPNSVDLTLSNTWKKIKANSFNSKNEKIIDPTIEMKYQEGKFRNMTDKPYIRTDCISTKNAKNYFVINPREFVLMATNEILNIPNGIMGFVVGRSSMARLSVQVEQAGLVDSGFRGTITLELYNQSQYPIILYEGMRIAQVYFIMSQFADQLYGLEKGSKYSGQIEATGSKIHRDFI